ncbi:Asp-tRNA(Asn)/Glu-tRNA(Gln) amidotransferase subunit GatA [Candidatus Laterigemmans baculatus]|uniref:Asp-tRNA(Asn)/Glu-tRNA(Gln) amidotransferase subunit GatA n=1 Tax=Candidatus Laterigemmans baculatus TaxID=2770505 RepID=UPI0013DAC533|nr:Asp-tRNA(Asn)/Glu-tRNA(Gln) amidotransferase subunit GatA [Candidatus Laterigemmans baculatus]
MSIPLDSATELLRLQAAGELSAVQITQAALDRIAATEPQISAFTHRADEAAIAAAEKIDRDRSAGLPLGPLAGIPVAVKDVLCTRDMPTTCSSKMLAGYHSPYDATVVARLRQAGAVLVGKTNMDEFAMGASTETSAMGVTGNPWDPSRTPGGSSGGAAAVVAAGNCPLSLGSDTGGSIRQPAAFCSLTGMKPTYGRVSRYGLVAFASSLDQVGPMAWTVEDAALLLQVISGFDPADSTSLDESVPNFASDVAATDVRGLRIGVLRDSLDQEGLEPEVRRAVLEAIDVYRSAGAEIVDVSLPHSHYWVPTYYVIAPCEASSNLSRYDGAHYGYRAAISDAEAAERGPLLATYCKSRDEGFGAEVKRRIMLGTYALSTGYYDAYYLKALKVRRLIRGDFDAAFAQADVLLGPVTPSAAFRLGEKTDDPLQMYLCDLFTVGANLAGIPAVSLPAGFTAEGLPLGVQLQAPPLQEARLIRAGAAFQKLTTHHAQRPTL